MTAQMSSLRLPEALMANFAPFLMIQLCFSPKAESQALERISAMGVAGLRISSKVTLMKVRSHIIRSRLRAVELYFLYSLGALRELLLSPLKRWMCLSISSLTKAKKPGCPGNRWLLPRMMATFSLTSEKAMPRKEFSALKTNRYWSRMLQKGQKGISLLLLQFSTRVQSWPMTYSMSNFYSFYMIIMRQNS